MRIELEEFRAFARTGMVAVRPLTFVVGENSSGKTSFLAALNYVWRLNSAIPTSFSAPPFDLGSFDEIVHRVRGRKRPDCFTINLDETIAFSIGERYSWLAQQNDKGQQVRKGMCRLSLTFSPNVGDAILSALDMSFENLALSVRIGSDIDIKVLRHRRVIYDTSKDANAELPLVDTQRSSPRLTIDLLDGFLMRSVFSASGMLTGAKRNPGLAMDIATVHTAFQAFLSSLPRSVLASAPVRSSPSRVYTRTDPGRSPQGSHTPQALFRIKKTDHARWLRMKKGIEEFGQLSGMFQRIDVTGFKSTSSSPFQISVTNKGRQSNLMDVGYGVSQALPILADLIESGPRSAFLFQQPEVHLHPQAQAALGSVFVRHSTAKKQAMIVAETHSDYIIDRVRYEVAQGRCRSDTVTILYFETAGSESKIHQISLDDEGNLLNVPSTYRDFFIKEQYRLLGLEDVSDN